MRIRLPGTAFLVGLLAACPALAQSNAGATRLYRLEPRSTFQRGCFDPCNCPIQEPAPLRGTFRLALASVGNVFDFYDVSHISWKAQFSNTYTIPIRGSGYYKVSTIAGRQQMGVDLVLDEDPPTHFDSDDVGIPVGFPRIDLTISINGMYCYDTVMELHARPTMRVRGRRNDLSWEDEPDEAAPWDVVYGDLGTLHSTGGDFAAATTGCLVRSYWSTTLAWDGDPPPGQAWWLLARRADGTFADGAPEQVGDPDAGIAASNTACQ